MNLIDHISIPMDLWSGIYHTGSSAICNPPVLDTDIDFIVCAKDEDKLHSFLVKNGFVQSIQDEEEYDLEGEGFSSYRKENINLIVTVNYEWYLKWTNATILAKKLNLQKKEDRITLFKYVLYDEL